MLGTGKVVPAQDDSFMDSDLDKDLEDLATPRSNEESVEGIWGMLLQVPAIVVALKLIKSFSYNCLKEATRYMLDNAQIKIAISFEDMLMAMTMFVLFADSVKIMVVEKSEAADIGVQTVSSICMFFFILELILNTWSKTTYSSFSPKIKFEGYLFSFYWWLDLIAIVSMWFDIDWIAVPMGIGGVSSSVSGTSNLAKAGRVVRLVRLVRLVKLFKIASERRKRAQQEQQLMELVAVGAISFLDIEKQRALNSERKSKLGSELSESTTRRVIVIVLIMVCILPLLSSPAPNTGPDYALSLIQHLQMDQTVSSEALNAIYDELSDDFHTRNGENYLIQLDSYVGMRRVYHLIDSDKFGKLRDDATYFEDVVAYNATRTKFETSATFSLRPLEYDSAMFSVLMTIFIGGLLVVGSVVFVGDTEELVLKPIGRMMNMVEEVAKDPLQPLNIGDNGGEYETRLLETTIEKITGLLRVGFGEAGAGIISANLSASDGGTSTINPLLPGVRVYAIVGFCDIHQFEFVNQNLASDILRFVNTIAEIVHSRVHYWGGQCNKNLGNAFVVIWRIGDEETLKNQITGFGKKSSLDKDMAQVVLQAQATNPASPNRLSAKFNSGGSTPTSATAAAATSPATAAPYASAASPAAPKVKSNVLDLRRVPGVDNLANQALIGYLKIIAEINRSLAVLTYRTEPRLTLHGQQEFSVRMGFGLHAGWAIEGAVGSLQKVDATYLSPHVNMAARLETSSRQYGVPILISHFTHELFSSEVQDYCRRVDVCTVKGSEVPIGVFTYDALQDQAFIHKNTRGKQEKWCPEDGPQIVQKKKIRRMDSTMTSAAKSSKKNTSDKMGFALDETGSQMNPEEDDQDDNPPVFAKSDEDPSDVFDNDVDLVMLRNHVTEEFLVVFKDGVDNYIKGDWSTAKAMLEKANALMATLAPNLGGDGPSKTLLEYMAEFSYMAPLDWKGYRPLTSK